MGLFGRILGGGAPPPPGGEPPGLFGGGSHDGVKLELPQVEAGPFPKRMRLRARLPEYNLLGWWEEVSLNSAEDYPAARAQVFGSYYKQFGMYPLPDGTSAIRWNELTWREIRDELEILYDPRYQG